MSQAVIADDDIDLSARSFASGFKGPYGKLRKLKLRLMQNAGEPVFGELVRCYTELSLVNRQTRDEVDHVFFHDNIFRIELRDQWLPGLPHDKNLDYLLSRVQRVRLQQYYSRDRSIYPNLPFMGVSVQVIDNETKYSFDRREADALLSEKLASISTNRLHLRLMLISVVSKQDQRMLQQTGLEALLTGISGREARTWFA